MCGRFTIANTARVIERRFGAKFISPAWVPTFNAAPSQFLPIITGIDASHITLAKWGFVPEWDLKHKLKPQINARIETTAEKPSFRDAYRSRHCIVIADGYYEWRRVGSRKIPYRFTRKDGDMMSFAGIWSRSSDESPTTFAVLTTDSVGEAKKYHHRMPVILRPGKERIWLPTGPGLLIPPQNEEDAIMAQRVSEAVNDVGFNAPEAIKPVADDSLLFIQKLA